MFWKKKNKSFIYLLAFLEVLTAGLKPGSFLKRNIWITHFEESGSCCTVLLLWILFQLMVAELKYHLWYLLGIPGGSLSLHSSRLNNNSLFQHIIMVWKSVLKCLILKQLWVVGGIHNIYIYITFFVKMLNILLCLMF